MAEGVAKVWTKSSGALGNFNGALGEYHSGVCIDVYDTIAMAKLCCEYGTIVSVSVILDASSIRGTGFPWLRLSRPWRQPSSLSHFGPGVGRSCSPWRVQGGEREGMGV